MTKWNFVTVLLCISVIGITVFTLPSFAQFGTNVSVNTDKLSYVDGDTIVISGNVKDILSETPLHIQIFDPLSNRIETAQKDVAQDGSFIHTIKATGPLWQEAGEYTVKVSYGPVDTVEVIFSFSPEKVMSETKKIFEVDAGSYGTFDVQYTIEGGTLEDIIIDVEHFALIVSINSIADGIVTLDIPRDLIAVTNGDRNDTPFIILIDGVEVSYQEITTSTSRTLTIQFIEGDSEIQIIGTLGEGSQTEEKTILVRGTDFFVDYSITGGQLQGIVIDEGKPSLIIGIDATGDGKLTITLPQGLIRAYGSDFSVFRDGEEIDFDVIETSTDSILTISFHAGTEEIEIITDQSTPTASAIFVSTDKRSYDAGETIVISGEVRELISQTPVTIQVISPNGSQVFVQQLNVSSDKSFITRITDTENIMIVSGTYTVIANYGIAARTTETTFEFSTGEVSIPIPEPAHTIFVSAPEGSSVPGCEETKSCFIPFEIIINVGDTVTWSNDDTAAHTVTSGSSANGPDGIFDSTLFMAGQSFSHTFRTSGTHDYFCMVHPWMTGIVNVEGDGSARPPTTMPPTTMPTTVRVSVDSSSYNEGDGILVQVSVNPVERDILGTIRILDSNGNLIAIDQFIPNSSGIYSKEFVAEGPLWKETGTYKVLIHYGDFSAETTFLFIGTSQVPVPTPGPPIPSGDVTIPAGSGVPGCETFNGCFFPATIRADAGGTITWLNADTAAHTVTSGSPEGGPNGIFDSTLFMAGQSFSHTFRTPGTYDYFCMVHPWMQGIAVIGQGGPGLSVPKPGPEHKVDLGIFVNERVFDLGDLVTMEIEMKGITKSQNVAIGVSNPTGATVVSRTVTIEPNSLAQIEFRISEDFKTGHYKVIATSSVEGKTIKESTHFKVKSQFNQFKIVTVEATDQQGRPSTFEKGTIGFIKVVLNSNKNIATLVTVNLFDSELTTIGIGSVKTTLSSGQSEIILSFMIPDDAAIGPANIFVNAFSDWPSNGGVPQTGEVAVQEEIL